MIFYNDNYYPATPVWDFQPNCDAFEIYNGYGQRDFVLMNIGVKKNGSGLVMVTTKSRWKMAGSANGELWIMLEDHTIIRCQDRNIQKQIDGKGISLYFLTKEQLQKISKSKITSIEFTYGILSERCSATLKPKEEPMQDLINLDFLHPFLN